MAIKNTFRLVAFVIALLGTLPCRAEGGREATFEKTDDFKLYYADESAGYFSCTLRGIYSTQARNYILIIYKGNAQDTLLKLQDPLNYQYFSTKFFDALKSKADTGVKPLAQRSTQQVFTWLYTINSGEEDENVTSGVLWLRQWIAVMPYVGPKTATATKGRIEKVDSISEKYGAIQAEVQDLSNQVDTMLSRAFENASSDVNTAFKAKALALMAKTDYDLGRSEFEKTMSPNIKKAQTDKDSLHKEVEAAKKTLSKALKADTVAKNLNDSEFKKDSTSSAYISANEAYHKSQADVKNATQALGNVTKSYEASSTELTQYAIEKAKWDEKVANADKVLIEQSAWYEKERNKSQVSTDKEAVALRRLLNSIRFGTVRSDTDSYLKACLSDIKDSGDSAKIKSAIGNYLMRKARLSNVQHDLRDSNIYAINRVSIVFERGYIERIQAWVDNGHGGEDIFENIYAIGITSINNLRSLDDVRLFVRKSLGDNRFIYLSDLIGNYDNFLSNLTRDYSPADTSLNNIFPSAQPRITLRKERLINLFDAKIFTDLAGLQQNAPNGLVQTEVSRRFNIHTFRAQVFRSRNDVGTFNYLHAYAALTKIEDKERRLPLRNGNLVQNNTLISPSYVTNIDLRRYENFSVGLNLNLGLFDAPDWKFTLYLDAGLRYGHVSVADSIRRIVNSAVDSPKTAIIRDAHTVTVEFPRLSVELFSERRVGLILSYLYNKTYLLDNSFKQVVSHEKSGPGLTTLPVERNARNMHSVEALMRVETSRSNNGKLFFRARFFWQHGDVNTFFPQFQIGYAYNLIFRK